MSKNKSNNGVTVTETAARTIQAAGRTIAGERGGRVANRITETLGLGRIDICDDPTCADCAPVK